MWQWAVQSIVKAGNSNTDCILIVYDNAKVGKWALARNSILKLYVLGF